MDRSRNILKNTFKFMASFIIMTLLIIIIFGISMSYIITGKSVINYAPIQKQIEPDKLDWIAIKDIGGRGIVVDDNGNVLKYYGKKGEKESYTKLELIDLFDLRGNNQTVFSYNTKNNKKLLIMYPKSVFTLTPELNVNTVMGDKSNLFFVPFIVGLLIYVFLVYKIIGKLSRRLKTEFDLIRADEDEKENIFFRGLAHDIKTPLSTIIAYSKALEDGIVAEGEIENYHKSIYNNGIILKERVDDMLKFTTLGNEGIFTAKEGDLLETIRRFIGDNYSWYIEKNVNVNIEFDDKDIFITNYDDKLFKRLLENLLQNSVYHNEKNINIFIEWDDNNKILIIYDNGKGVPDNIKEHMWKPMVTGDESRTGEKLRGMGLANVKRIVELHGWYIKYDGKFKISI